MKKYEILRDENKRDELIFKILGYCGTVIVCSILLVLVFENHQLKPPTIEITEISESTTTSSNNIKVEIIGSEGNTSTSSVKPTSSTPQNDNETINNTSSKKVASANQQVNTGKININSASQTELETLKGIGEVTARKIITYRNENGNFKSIEDIVKVSGIGTSKYNDIKDHITVE